MNVSLTPQLEKLVQKKVKTGSYQTASEVIRAGLRLLQERDEELAWVRKEVAKGEAEIERGEYIEIANEADQKKFFADIKKRGRERLAAERRRKAK